MVICIIICFNEVLLFSCLMFSLFPYSFCIFSLILLLFHISFLAYFPEFEYRWICFKNPFSWSRWAIMWLNLQIVHFRCFQIFSMFFSFFVKSPENKEKRKHSSELQMLCYLTFFLFYNICEQCKMKPTIIK